jgi:hypothetical protein
VRQGGSLCATTPQTSSTCPSTKQIVFIPVDGRLVFFTCLVLIAFCVIWLLMLCKKGVKFEEGN